MAVINPNPNGANGTTSDPREQIMWDIYVSKLAKGYDNAYESAIDAGYEESSAKHITLRRWFIDRKDRLRRKDMLSKAEKVLDKTLSYPTVDEEGKVDTGLLRIQTDVAKHVTETLGKEDGYSKRSEITGKDGDAVNLGVIMLPPKESKINKDIVNNTPELGEND